MVWVNVAGMAGWSQSAVLAFVPAVHLPSYSHTEVLIGSAILLALCLIVLVVMAVAWWRRR
jgi:membrane protein DedA with SNARE-associated domain